MAFSFLQKVAFFLDFLAMQASWAMHTCNSELSKPFFLFYVSKSIYSLQNRSPPIFLQFYSSFCTNVPFPSIFCTNVPFPSIFYRANKINWWRHRMFLCWFCSDLLQLRKQVCVFLHFDTLIKPICEFLLSCSPRSSFAFKWLYTCKSCAQRALSTSYISNPLFWLFLWIASKTLLGMQSVEDVPFKNQQHRMLNTVFLVLWWCFLESGIFSA